MFSYGGLSFLALSFAHILLIIELIPSLLTLTQSLVVSETNCSIAEEAQNASVMLTWNLFIGDVNYTRISHSSEVLLSTSSSLSDRLVILGGIEYESAQPVVDSPVLVYSIATNTFYKPQDQILSAVSEAYKPTGFTFESVFVSPASRKEHASFVQDGAIFLFGGQSREFLNDTWRGCVDASSSNIIWDELVTSSDAITVASAPVPRVGHSFTKVFENSTMIGALVFGGLSGDYMELNGLHLAFLTRSSYSSAPACTNRNPKLSWRMLNAVPLTDSGTIPAARAYHAAMTTSKLFTSTKLACLIVHGGKNTQQGVIFNELWRLCPPLTPDTTIPVEKLNYTWELLTEIGTTPGARYGASMTFVDEGKLALAGGSYTFPSDFLSDTWELNVNATQWIRLSFTEDYTPPRRGHSLSFFSTTTRLFLFGGRDRYAVVKKRMQAAYYGAPFCANGLKITFCTATSKYVCIACPAGSYLESGSRKCSLCPQGTFSSAGAAECTKCPAGTFSSDFGKDSSSPCTLCSTGTFSQAVGAVSIAACNACTAGTFTASLGSVSCSSCTAGTFSRANASTCTVCPRGKYSSAGAGTCADCATGSYAPNTGSTLCFSCPRGFFSNLGDVGCSACPVNTYSVSIGVSASDCRACPSYAFTTSSGQSSCKFCPSGSSWTGTVCSVCSKGFYSASSTNGACIACPRSSYAADSGSSSCQSCPNGKFNGNTGTTNSSDCQLCSNGSFLSDTTCQTCGAGTYPEPSGYCSLCHPGSYFSGGGTSLGCSSCPSMSYSSSAGATSCSVCAENTFSMEGWRNCISCTTSQTSLPGCVTGRNGILCSGNGDCVYGGCTCTSNWVGGDCSVPVNDTAATTASAVLYFPDAPLQLVNASTSTTMRDIQVRIARSGSRNSRLQASVAWRQNNFSSTPSLLPATLEFACGEFLHTITIPISQLSPRNGCRFFTLSLIDVTGAGTSAVSSDSDNTLTVYVDDMNGVSGGVTGRSVASMYTRQANGTALAAVALDRTVAIQLTLTPQSNIIDANFGLSLRDQPLNLLIAIDISAVWVSAFMDLLPALVAQLQIVYRSVPDGVRLGLLSDTTATFYSSLAEFFAAAQALNSSSVGNAPIDWDWVSKGLVASTSWPGADRRHILIVAGDTLTAGGSITLPSALINQLRSQNTFAFTLSSTQVTFTSGSDVMKSVAYGTTAAIPSVLRQIFEQRDNTLPPSANVLSDPAGLVSSVQVAAFSSGSSSLPVVSVSIGPFPAPDQLTTVTSLTVTIGVPGGSMISIEVRESEQACFPPVHMIALDPLPLSGWADAWHLSTLNNVQRLWKSSTGSSTLRMTLYQDTSVLRKWTSTILSLSDSASTHLSLARTYPGSFFAVGLSLITRGYWRSGSDSGTATCSIVVNMVSTNTSLNMSRVDTVAPHTIPGEWNYRYLRNVIPWELSSLTIALKCNTSSPGVIVEWAGLGLLPDPDFACMCPRGFYHDTLSGEDGEGSCVRCAAGSYCAAGIKRQCPDGTFSFGKSASCETCRDGWICTDGLARLCDPGTYSSSFSCAICPSGYACRNGEKSICLAGTFSPKLSSECKICPPGTISRSDGSFTCELCPLGMTSNYQRDHCISCPPGEATLYTSQHPCSSCIASSFPTRNQPEMCLA